MSYKFEIGKVVSIPEMVRNGYFEDVGVILEKGSPAFTSLTRGFIYRGSYYHLYGNVLPGEEIKDSQLEDTKP